MKMNVRALSAAFGAVAGAMSLVLGVWFCVTGFGKPAVDTLSSLYAGIVRFSYNPVLSLWANLTSNLLNIFLLVLFTAADGLLIGFIFGAVYNLFLPREKQ